MNVRTEFWLQQKNKDGIWRDCGPDHSAEAIWTNIANLQSKEPTGKWRCIERTIVESVIEPPKPTPTP